MAMVRYVFFFFWCTCCLIIYPAKEEKQRNFISVACENIKNDKDSISFEKESA